jgi:hydrogenase-4 component F
MHTWLPDAHSEAPSPVSALLSGALLNCAFLAILRLHQLSIAAGFADFSREILILTGLFSLVIAALFIVGQADYKRMLAYSSVEHMGILALGVGLGALGSQGSMLQLTCHSLTKAALFLLAGNILSGYRTKNAAQVSGMGRFLPWSGPLWFAAFFAVAGLPPFGIFAAEFTILRAALHEGFGLTPVLYLLCLGFIFTGMAWTCLRMFLGPLPANTVPKRESPAEFLAPLCLLGLCLFLSLHQPVWLQNILNAAARSVSGAPSL